jgi:ABC-type phosphate/phosphonate transport system substrate-binding protein
MKRFTVCLIAAIMIASFATTARSQTAGKTYIYGLWPTMGAQSSTLNNYIKSFVQVVFDHAGEKIKFIDIEQSKVVSAIKTKKVDFVYVTPDMYVDLLKSNVKISPVLAPGAQGHIRENLCFITLKSSPIASIKDLRGKSVNFSSDLGDFLALRTVLISKGINEPLNKFFKGGNAVDNDSSSIQNLIDGKVDVVSISNHGLNFQKYANATYKAKTKIIDCGEVSWPPSPIVWVGTPDPQALKKVYETLPKLPSFPEFKKFQPLVKMMQFQLSLVSEKDYTEMVKTFNDAKKKGWLAEFNAMGGK